MYRYITTPPESPFRKSLAPLALSGISFGLGVASKWIVAYAAVGLAVIYIIRQIQLSNHFKSSGTPGFRVYIRKTLLFSVLFFGVVPVVIYLLSYIPFALASGLEGGIGAILSPGLYREFFGIVWENQIYMFTYHAGLDAVHPYSSSWWQWVVNALPILYFDSLGTPTSSVLAAFGNPVVWWGGFVAMVFMAVSTVKNNDGKALFILIGYLSQLVPWMLVSRIVFIYHYFPSTLFLVLGLSYILCQVLERKRGSYKLAAYGFTCGAGALFVMFYPALTGIPAPTWYFGNVLRWFHIWPF